MLLINDETLFGNLIERAILKGGSLHEYLEYGTKYHKKYLLYPVISGDKMEYAVLYLSDHYDLAFMDNFNWVEGVKPELTGFIMTLSNQNQSFNYIELQKDQLLYILVDENYQNSETF